MNRPDLPPEQLKEVLELKLEIANMNKDLKTYMGLHEKIIKNFRYSISRKSTELIKICPHNNTVNNDMWDYHNNVGYTHINCVDCGKLVKSV